MFLCSFLNDLSPRSKNIYSPWQKKKIQIEHLAYQLFDVYKYMFVSLFSKEKDDISMNYTLTCEKKNIMRLHKIYVYKKLSF